MLLETIKELNMLHQLFNKLNVVYNKGTLEKLAAEDPYFPSLLSMGNLLKDFHIPNLAVKLTHEDLQSIPLPALAYLDNGEYVIIEQIEPKRIHYKTQENNVVETIDTFTKKWSGTTILLNKEEQSIESNYSTNRKKIVIESLRTPVIFCLIFLLFCLTTFQLWHASEWLITCLLLLKSIGIAISILLLFTQNEIQTKATERFCESSKKSSCNQVLNSNGAKLFGLISLAEISLMYFSASCIYILLMSIQNPMNPSIALLAILNLLAVPITIFSILYQWKIVKTWCPLCLIVVVVILLETPIDFLYIRQPLSFSDYSIFIIALSLPTIAWLLFYPNWQLALAHPALTRKLNRFRNDGKLLSILLHEGKRYLVHPFIGDIVLGNPNAKHFITLVTNPECKPCAEAHTVIASVLKEFEDDVACRIRFIKPDPVAKYLISLDQSNYPKVADAIHDWFLLKDKNELTARHYLPESQSTSDKVNAYLVEHRNWCTAYGITHTPTILIDDYPLPMQYNVNDIKYYFREIT